MYNDNGSLTKKTLDDGTVYDFTYNVRNRLETVSKDNVLTATYKYDALGRRISKTVGATTEWFHYSVSGLIAEYSDDWVLIKSYGYMPGSINGTNLWGTNPLYQNVGGEVYFYLNDQRGAPCRMVNKLGMIVWSDNYDAFGARSADYNQASPADVRVETVTNNLRPPGQYFDMESGLHYNWHRYYEPETGRYMSVDPLRDGMNYYAYCGADPLGNIDPFGLWFDGFSWKHFGKALLETAVTIAKGVAIAAVTFVVPAAVLASPVVAAVGAVAAVVGVGYVAWDIGQRLYQADTGNEIDGWGRHADRQLSDKETQNGSAVGDGVALAGTLGTAKAAEAAVKKAAKKGYRAVSDAELKDIKASGEIRPEPTGRSMVF